MGNKKIFFVIVILIISTSCRKLNNPKERNMLIFEDELNLVIDAIGSMNNILINSGIKPHFFYAVDSDTLYIKDDRNNSKRIGLISDTLLFKNNLLSIISLDERKSFMKLVLFLSNNHMERCDFEDNKFVYVYRSNIYMADRQKDLMRFVVLENSINDIDLTKYKILDNKGKLYLLAYKNAEIWKN